MEKCVLCNVIKLIFYAYAHYCVHDYVYIIMEKHMLD